MVRIVILVHLSILFMRVLYVLYRDIDLSSEEAQYWLWSKHLDLSYYSKPPMIAYLNFLSTSIFGDTEIGVRISAIFLGFLTALGVFFFSRYFFKDEKLAFFSSVFLYFVPSYQLGSILFLTDSPLGFFYFFLVFFFFRATQTNSIRDWILTGLSGGLAFYSKFSGVLFLLPALVYVYLFRRELFREKWLYISIAIAGLFTIPVLYWNIQNDFVSFKHVGKLAGVNQSSIHLKHTLEYIAGQIGIASPFLFPFMAYSIYRAFKDRDKRLIYLSLNGLLVFIVFLLISLKKNVEANWPAFAYTPVYILTSYYVYRLWLKEALIPMILSLVSILILLYTPVLDNVGLGKVVPPKIDPSKRLVGWQELGMKVGEEIKELDRFFIFSDSYHIASELAFYVPGNPQTYCVRIDRRMNQFDIWEGMDRFENKGYWGVYVADHPIPEKVRNGFESVYREDVYRVKYRGEFVREYYIYVLKNYKQIEQDPITSF